MARRSDGPEAANVKALPSVAADGSAKMCQNSSDTSSYRDEAVGANISSGMERAPERGRYPHVPGSKGADGTSQKAAAHIARRVAGLRRAVLEAIAVHGNVTVLELVAHTGMNRYSIQPRVSELRAMGLVESTGERRKNPSGQGAAVQRLTATGRALL